MMNRTERDLRRPAALQMPQQAPPIDRATPIPTPALSNIPGVEAANFSLPWKVPGFPIPGIPLPLPFPGPLPWDDILDPF